MSEQWDSVTVARSRPEKLELRRLHNHLLFVEHASNLKERQAAGEYVFRALRRYLSQFHGLERRP